MIQVQIASQITADGVQGLRWVLVEPEPTLPAATPTAAPAAAAQASPSAGATASPPGAGTTAEAPRSSVWQLPALKLAVVALGLGAAVWTARLQLGSPAAGGAAAGAASAARPAAPASAARLQHTPAAAPRVPQPVQQPLPAGPAGAEVPAPAPHPPRLTAAL